MNIPTKQHKEEQLTAEEKQEATETQHMHYAFSSKPMTGTCLLQHLPHRQQKSHFAWKLNQCLPLT